MHVDLFTTLFIYFVHLVTKQAHTYLKYVLFIIYHAVNTNKNISYQHVHFHSQTTALFVTVAPGVLRVVVKCLNKEHGELIQLYAASHRHFLRNMHY